MIVYDRQFQDHAGSFCPTPSAGSFEAQHPMTHGACSTTSSTKVDVLDSYRCAIVRKTVCPMWPWTKTPTAIPSPERWTITKRRIFRKQYDKALLHPRPARGGSAT